MAALIQEPAPRATEIALERGLAERLELRVGDTVRLGAAPDSMTRLAVVAAIYEPRPDPAELSRQGKRVRMHLPDLAALLDAPDRVDRFGIGLAPGVDGRQRGRGAQPLRVRLPGPSFRRDRLGVVPDLQGGEPVPPGDRLHHHRRQRGLPALHHAAQGRGAPDGRGRHALRRRPAAHDLRRAGPRGRAGLGARLDPGRRPRLARGSRHQLLLPAVLRHRADLQPHHPEDRALQRLPLAAAGPRGRRGRGVATGAHAARWCCGAGHDRASAGACGTSVATRSAPRSRSPVSPWPPRCCSTW